jgi:hypothetical protein
LPQELPAGAGNIFTRTAKPPNQYSRDRAIERRQPGRTPDFQPRCVDTHHINLLFITVGETRTADAADTSDPSEENGVF